uniref:Uncharacterized protein n=1 Tax=Leersia perrieri TaxID=77586 RepID=A0A0D9XL93_9ORYZ
MPLSSPFQSNFTFCSLLRLLPVPLRSPETAVAVFAALLASSPCSSPVTCRSRPCRAPPRPSRTPFRSPATAGLPALLAAPIIGRSSAWTDLETAGAANCQFPPLLLLNLAGVLAEPEVQNHLRQDGTLQRAIQVGLWIPQYRHACSTKSHCCSRTRPPRRRGSPRS